MLRTQALFSLCTTHYALKDCCLIKSFLVENFDSFEFLSFEHFQRRAAAGGDVRYFVGKAELLDSRCGVAAADDGDAVCIGNCLSDSNGSLGEGRHFGNAHRAVPDNRLGAFDQVGVQLSGFRTDVQSFKAVRNLTGVNGELVAFFSKGVAAVGVNRKNELVAAFG